MKSSKLMSSIKILTFIIVITAISTFCISYVNYISSEKISLNEAMFTKKAVLQAAGMLKETKSSNENIESIYAKNVRGVKGSQGRYYQVSNGNYVFPVIGTGLWGKINGVVGVDKNLRTLTGISFISNEETPGLGARITELWFCRQFKGKEGPINYVPEGTNGKVNEFDGITGATITTNAVKEMVNETLKNAENKIGEVNNG